MVLISYAWDKGFLCHFIFWKKCKWSISKAHSRKYRARFFSFFRKTKTKHRIKIFIVFSLFFFYFICNIHLLSSSSVFLNVTVCLVIMTGININVQLLQWELYLMLLASGSSSQSSKWRLIWCRKRNAKLVLLIIVHMRLRQFSAIIHYVTVAKYGEYYLQEMSASTLSTENLRPQLSTFFLYFFKSCEV